MADVKRAHSPETNGHAGAIVKRQRVEDGALTQSTKAKPEVSEALQCTYRCAGACMTALCCGRKHISCKVFDVQGPARTSGLLAPIMLLTGHAGEVFTCKFNPTGDVIASGSHDKHIFLWRTYGECENYMMMKGERSHQPNIPLASAAEAPGQQLSSQRYQASQRWHWLCLGLALQHLCWLRIVPNSMMRIHLPCQASALRCNAV
jgi:hypothetical protein